MKGVKGGRGFNLPPIYAADCYHHHYCFVSVAAGGGSGKCEEEELVAMPIGHWVPRSLGGKTRYSSLPIATFPTQSD